MSKPEHRLDPARTGNSRGRYSIPRPDELWLSKENLTAISR